MHNHLRMIGQFSCDLPHPLIEIKASAEELFTYKLNQIIQILLEGHACDAAGSRHHSKGSTACRIVHKEVQCLLLIGHKGHNTGHLATHELRASDLSIAEMGLLHRVAAGDICCCSLWTLPFAQQLIINQPILIYQILQPWVSGIAHSLSPIRYES